MTQRPMGKRGPDFWDKRVRDRYLADGTISQSDLDKHINGLPDRSDQAEDIALQQPALDGDDDSED